MEMERLDNADAKGPRSVRNVRVALVIGHLHEIDSFCGEAFALIWLACASVAGKPEVSADSTLPRYLPAMIHTRIMGSGQLSESTLLKYWSLRERERRWFRSHFVPGVYIEDMTLLRFEPRRSLWSLGKGVVAGRSRSLNIHLNWRSLSP